MPISTKIVFRNMAKIKLAVKVFYGSTQGKCIDKPYRNHFTIDPGATHKVDVGEHLACYCDQDQQFGVPPDECTTLQATPGETVDLI
jgi:hypothetical protein